MFQQPISNIDVWTVTDASLTVLQDHTLRYPGYELRAVQFETTSAQTIFLPVKSFVKIRATSTNTILELEPLLISDTALAKKFVTGFPSLYIQLPGIVTTVTDGLFDTGFSLGDFTAFTLAIQFSDRVERDVSLCADIILTAMQGSANTSSWEKFAAMLRPVSDIVLLSANGQRFTGAIRLRFAPGSGTAEEFDYVPGTTSLKQRIGSQLPGTLSLANLGPNPGNRVLWINIPGSGEPTVAYTGTLVSAETRVILLADLFDWFAPQSRSDQPHTLPRFSKGNKITSFVNGPAYFKDLFAELHKAAISEGRFYLTGYAIFQDDQLILTDENVPKTLLDATKNIVDAQGQCYYLPLQLIQLRDGNETTSLEEVLKISVVIALILADGGVVLYYAAGVNGNTYTEPFLSTVVLVGAGVVAYLTYKIIESNLVLEFIQKSSSVEGLDLVNNTGKSRKIWAIHPATWEDNSFQGDGDGIVLVDIAKAVLPGVTAYHQKIALVKNTQWVAYCGGIDLNPNRMDDARHLALSPYHDVHARVTGPAARDLAITFIDRWNDEAANDDQISINNEANLPPPDPIPGADHVVQVARTNFQANPITGANRAFSYAPTGDRTILDTLLKAINSAKEYIYIEDQYFTPTPEFCEALINALNRGLKSLVVIMPNSPDQPYGETKRSPFIDELLALNSGTNRRVRIGFSRRSYVLPPTTLEVLNGRMMLGRDLSESDLEIVLGPINRQLTFPFWISVDGEIMLVTGIIPGSVEVPAGETPVPGRDYTYKVYQHYNLERGDANNFFDAGKGYIKRKHQAGATATAVVFNGIYIHSKCMMVDDVFASIGSANMNRRGFHSDAEANIFFMSESLRFAPANPIAALRKELWAELLNIPHAMGNNLLEDPVAASKLFDRDCSTGNRFIPYRAVSTLVKTNIPKIGDIPIDATFFQVLNKIKDVISALAIPAEAFDFEEVFHYITDPSSFTQNPPETE